MLAAVTIGLRRGCEDNNVPLSTGHIPIPPPLPPATRPLDLTNAADVYRFAFQLLHQADEAPDALSVDWDVAGQELMERALAQRGAALEAFHRARNLDRCEWISMALGSNAPADLGHEYGELRQLAIVARSQVRTQMSLHNPKAGVDALVDLLTFARRVGNRPVYMDRLVAIAIESDCLDAAGPYLAALSPSLASQLLHAFDTLRDLAKFDDVLKSGTVEDAARARSLEDQMNLQRLRFRGILMATATRPS
jgi:hypothetical protein